jgi:tetratricopeptide (TPR) repeat protein
MAGELLMEEGRERLERSRAVLREAGGGVLGLARAAVIEGSYHWSMCEAEAARAAFEEGLAYAESIGYLAAIDGFRSSLTPCYVFGPTPVAEAVERLATLREEAESRQLLLARSAALRGMGRMLVLDGRFDEAQALFDEAFAGLLESGIRAHYWNAWGQAHAFLARAAGDSEREERVLREAHAQLEELGERIGHSTIAANLARSLLIQGRLEEAAKSAATARRLTLAEDASNLILADGVDALVAVERGDGETALRLARRIDELTRPTDFFQMHGWTGQVLERVGQAVGDESLAAEGRRAALDAYERKGARTIAKLVAAGELF